MIVFDTDVISYVLRRSPPAPLLRRIAEIDPQMQATTSINIGELVYGAHRSTDPAPFLSALQDTLLTNMTILSFDEKSARIYGEVRALLEKRGTPISEPDLRIGAICRANKASLATGNIRHFAKIPDLVCQDWLAAFR